MSAGGVFKLIANDGKADKMIMATDLLINRIKDITCKKMQQGYADATPSLVDIERTHILYVNAHYKPFAAIGYEYNKVRANTGNPQFGGTVQFSIPQFGDFFNDMVVNVTLETAAAIAGTVPAFPGPIGADDQDLAQASYSASATRGAASGIYTKYTYEYVNLAGTVINTGDAATNFVRYAEYPGQALFTDIKFEVNGNPLDEYRPEAVVFYQKFRIPPNKIVGWKRMVGQEVPTEAYSDVMAIDGTSNYSCPLDMTLQAGGAAPGAPVSSAITARKIIQVVNGPQTPKATQPELDIWNPLIFWFNTDPRLSIPSVSIPYGMRFITIAIEQQSNILFVAPGNLFLRLTIETQYSAAGANKGLMTAEAVQTVNKWITLTPTLATGSIVNTTQRILNMDLYINNIFVIPEVHDIYIKRIGFSLIRLYKYQLNTQAVSTDNILLSQLKYPVEMMYIGMRPLYNQSAANPNKYRDWHRMTLMTDNPLELTANSTVDVMASEAVAFNAASPLHKTASCQWMSEHLSVPTHQHTIDTLKLQAHGITIYDEYKAAFYASYLPYTFGGYNIITPEDPGALMMNFALYPGTYQPSGHMNVSRAREFYLQYTSSYVSAAQQATLIVIATAINFLLISDGSAVLRYTT